MARLNREESQARTRDLLIEAARDQIAQKGFTKASVRDIADAAGYSQGAFYSNFSSKEDLLLEVVRKHQTEERAKIKAALEHAKGHAESALIGIEKWATTINSDPAWAVLAIELQLQALRSPPFALGYRELNQLHLQELGAMIAKLFVVLGKELPCSPIEVAAGFVALGRGMSLLSQDVAAGSTARIIVMFLKAVISDAAPAAEEGV